MKINLSQSLLDPNGTPIPESDLPNSKPVTLGSIVCQALLAQFQGDNSDGAEKHRRYKLWALVKNGGEQDFPAEEIAMVKQLIGKGWSPLIVGQCWEMLEGRDVGGVDQTASDRMLSHQSGV